MTHTTGLTVITELDIINHDLTRQTYNTQLVGLNNTTLWFVKSGRFALILESEAANMATD